MPSQHDQHASLMSETVNFHSLPPQGFYTPTCHPIGKNQNAQFKEKALSWAHTVYVDLLAFLHRSKKPTPPSKRSHGLGRSYSQGSIYPKPPRQPASNYSLQNHASTTFLDGKINIPPGDRLVGATQLTGGWRGSHTLTSHLEYKRSIGGSNLYRKPNDTNSYIRSERRDLNSITYSGDQNNAIDSAKAALEMLTNLCQESEWRWIDGMLLGGCLAYGLEDYQKALDWYTKIVTLDPRSVIQLSYSAQPYLVFLSE